MRCFLPFADSNRGRKTRVTGFPVFMEIESREWTAQDLTSQLVMQRPWLADWKYRYNRCTNRGSPVSCFHRCLSHYFKKKTHKAKKKARKVDDSSQRFFAKDSERNGRWKSGFFGIACAEWNQRRTERIFEAYGSLSLCPRVARENCF